MTEPFNPLDRANLADSVASHIDRMEPTPLDGLTTFFGAGVYALYYTGDHPIYADLVNANSESLTHPIYVGKAVPKGSRRGIELADYSTDKALFERLSQHATTLRQTADLDIEDFLVRWLVVDDIWIPLGESAMIRRYRPVWNAMADGFGNKTPGARRMTGTRSLWDTLHPGREWAKGLADRKDGADKIAQDVVQYLADRLN